jgi:hypothetical protein
MEARLGSDFSGVRVHDAVTIADYKTARGSVDCTLPAASGSLTAPKPPRDYARAPSRILQRACTCEQGSGLPCAACSATTPEPRSALRTSRHPLPGSPAPASVRRALGQPGRRLGGNAAETLGRDLGLDPGNVVVHTDDAAAESAAAVAANAYTVGNHIVFGAGQFAPETDQGRRLLAHELVHVAQVGGARADMSARLRIGDPHSHEESEAERIAGSPQAALRTAAVNRAATALVRRDPQTKPAPTPTAAPAAAPASPAQSTFHIVIRDPGIDLGGGTLVPDLEAAKQKLLARRVSDAWTLVLSIHASDRDVVAAQSPPDWQKNAKFYTAANISSLFGGDAAFVAWRARFGPTRVVLYGCQVNASFEQTIADNLSRDGKGQTAQGLGPHCKPLSTSKYFGVKTRREFNKLAADEQAKMTGEVQAENRMFGYYGGPPVPDDKVLDYLFDGPGKGTWASVEVKIGGSSQKPPIAYWNRTSNHTFLQNCEPVNPLRRTHTPSAPVVP